MARIASVGECSVALEKASVSQLLLKTRRLARDFVLNKPMIRRTAVFDEERQNNAASLRRPEVLCE
jgi:hypothetical protein